jgi:hypothetical protein
MRVIIVYMYVYTNRGKFVFVVVEYCTLITFCNEYSIFTLREYSTRCTFLRGGTACTTAHKTLFLLEHISQAAPSPSFSRPSTRSAAHALRRAAISAIRFICAALRVSPPGERTAPSVCSVLPK